MPDLVLKENAASAIDYSSALSSMISSSLGVGSERISSDFYKFLKPGVSRIPPFFVELLKNSYDCLVTGLNKSSGNS